jgi:hypothetical protein
MHAGYRAAAFAVGAVAAWTLLVSPAAGSSFRCSVATEAYGDVVASGIKPLPATVGKGAPGAAACVVADAVVGEAAFRISRDHAASANEPYPTSLKLTLERPGGVNAIETWRYRIRYTVKGSMHGFGVASCGGQKVTFTLVPHTPRPVAN